MHFILLLLSLISCSTSNLDEKWRNFEGRSKGTEIYRARVPLSWEILLPESLEYLTDTTLPIFSCKIPYENESVFVTIHNFPTKSIEESIQPELQVQRWQNQFSSYDPASLNHAEIAHGGFHGYLFEATGVIKNQSTSVLAIAMQMIPEHYRMLQNNPAKEEEFKQMRADYTIKAIGSSQAVNRLREEILLFAESFELIHPIPSRV